MARALANLKISIEETGAMVTFDSASTSEPSTFDPRRSTLPMVMADAFQLTQLFQNLISNALKFRSPGAASTNPDCCQRRLYGPQPSKAFVSSG
jgi:signal transduction histidine kinase